MISGDLLLSQEGDIVPIFQIRRWNQKDGRKPPVLVIYCGMTNYSQMESKHLSFLQFLWVRDSETVYLSSSGFAVSNEVAIKVLVMAAVT